MSNNAKRILIAEFTPGHDECIFSTYTLARALGYEVTIAANARIRNRLEEELEGKPCQMAFFNFRNGVKGWKAYRAFHRFMLEGGFTHLYFNTAQCSIVWLYFMLFSIPRHIRVLGTMHGIDRMKHDWGQRFITRRTDQYVLLSDCLRHSFSQVCSQKPGVVYSIHYPQFHPASLHKPLGEVWIVVPGSLELKRRDYGMLLSDRVKQLPPHVKIVLLGNIEHGDGPSILQGIQELGAGEHFVTFRGRVANDMFYAYIQQADYILPLNHDPIYWTDKISGSYNLAFGYRKPMLCPAEMHGIEDFEDTAYFYSQSQFYDFVTRLATGLIATHPTYTLDKWDQQYQIKKMEEIL